MGGSKKIRILLILFIFITISLSCINKHRQKIFLIPEGYSGEVRIFWNDKNSKNRMLKYSDEYYVTVLTGDLTNFRLADEPTPSGYYDIKYYYYSKDTLYQIASAGYTNLPDNCGAGNGYWGETNGEKVYGFTVRNSK